MNDLLNILDDTSDTDITVVKQPVRNYEKKAKLNPFEDDIPPLPVDKDKLLRFNRMVTFKSHGTVPPSGVAKLMKVAEALTKLGFCYRFDGSHTAEQDGLIEKFGSRVETYLPWKKFRSTMEPTLGEPHIDAYGHASYFHTKFNNLPVKAFLAREVHVMLGSDLKTPVNLLLFYSDSWDGDMGNLNNDSVGYARFMLGMANKLDVKVFNLANDGAIEEIVEFLKPYQN
jgi:hypothetical protein